MSPRFFFLDDTHKLVFWSEGGSVWIWFTAAEIFKQSCTVASEGQKLLSPHLQALMPSAGLCLGETVPAASPKPIFKKRILLVDI